MTHLELFGAYAAAFEETYVDDNWRRLEPFVHEEIVYEVCNIPFHCALAGRDQVLQGIAKSVNGFDRRCTRTLATPDVLKEEGNRVLVHGGLSFTYKDQRLEATLLLIATLQDGVIGRLQDIYAPGDEARYLEFVRQWPNELDASYC